MAQEFDEFAFETRAIRAGIERSDQGEALKAHLISGAGVEVLVQLAPVPAIGLRLVDSDGSYVALRTFTPA